MEPLIKVAAVPAPPMVLIHGRGRAILVEDAIVVVDEKPRGVIVNERRGRIQPERSTAFLALLDELPIMLQPLPSDAGVLDLARRLRLSIYGAAYLELAVCEGVPLATLDDTLRVAAREVKTRCWEPQKTGG